MDIKLELMMLRSRLQGKQEGLVKVLEHTNLPNEDKQGLKGQGIALDYVIQELNKLIGD
jgi:hypothetical protein